MSIIEKMYELFEKTGKTHKELADLLGLSSGQISAWRRRKTDPPASLLNDICKFFGVSLEELLGVSDKRAALTENQRELLNVLERFPDERVAAKFVGKAELLADEMLAESDKRAKRLNPRAQGHMDEFAAELGAVM